MAYKYSFEKFNKETMARASTQNAQISLKKSVETAKAIKGKKISTVINYLEKVIEQKAVVPYTRYNTEMPHRKGSGIMAGGYPVKVAEELLRLVKAAEKNADNQEISGNLIVISCSVRKGSSRYHYGRYMGRKMKSTNVEVIVGLKQ
jgi:large subunit ribosomal protein L22